jgi:fructose/tagatose bisphosphate aldolase
MALVSLRQVLDHAAEFGCGVPAFNVNNLEQVQAIMEAAQATQSPVILQASAGARKYAGEAGEEDGVDALAIAIGTSHSQYTFGDAWQFKCAPSVARNYSPVWW